MPGPTEVLVATRRSLISAGTENAVRNLASASLVSKAKARPDLVRQVIDKARADGVRNTLSAVRTRLDDQMPLGYSAMGIAVAVGEAVEGIQPGDRVATASAGHGDYQLVPGLLCAKVPGNVDDASAAFATVGAIALHGLRQGELTVDESVAVIGLGLVGQITARLAQASGLRVIGIDLQPHLVELAEPSGVSAHVEAGAATTRAILDATDGHGVDAVVITAATQSSEPVSRATDILRDRGRILVVGDVGLDLDRRPFYEKEIDLRFARSYGPGRYDRSYEEFGIDMPAGYVRWTEGRNLQAVLSLISRGLVSVTDLVTKTYPLEDAEEAYASFTSTQAPLGVQFTYDAPAEQPPRASRPTPAPLIKRESGDLRAGIIGAGTYAKATLLPALQKAGWPRPVAITSASGLNARTLANKFNIPTVTADSAALINDPNVSVVFILSRHDSHADLTEKALLAGKDVFVEKPLALTWNELERVEKAQQESGRILWAGFNRRYSAAVKRAKALFAESAGPLVANYSVNAGSLPESHWYNDRRQGGRLLGEVCHFIDTISWIFEEAPDHVSAFGDGRGEALLQENLTLALHYPSGSSASISYSAEGSPRTSKERLEILGHGHTLVIDDFKSLTIDGKDDKVHPADKGHAANLRSLADALQGKAGPTPDIRASLETTDAALQALNSLITGGPRVH
jgi:hypothetical protein